MMETTVQKPNISGLSEIDYEGLSVLTSELSSTVDKYCARVPRSFETFAFDGTLYDAVKALPRLPIRVKTALSDSIQDEHCTKQFYDVTKTFSQFDKFQESEPANALWNVNLRAACAVVKSQMKLKPIQPQIVECEEDLLDVWTNPKASAGLINLGKSKKDSVEEAFKFVKLIKKRLNMEEERPFQIPAQVFHRAQISGFVDEKGYNPQGLKKKDRFVWGLDGATVAIEGQYAKPLIEHISKNWFGYAGGKSPEELRRNIARSREFGCHWLSIDYSKFDQTVPSWLIYWCFEVVKSVFDEKYHKELDWIAYNFVNTKVVIPGRGEECKRKGIPSGSNFTQLIGSMVNAVMAMSYIASTCPGKELQGKISYVKKVLRVNTTSSDTAMFVMGDDNLMFTTRKLDIEDLSRYVNLVFGVLINSDKCEWGTTCEDPSFLKRIWRPTGEYQDPAYLFVNVIHPERKRSYKGYSPWHILFGLYLTYPLAFPGSVSERWLAEQMKAHGGIKALECIPRSDLPGVFRAFGDDALRSMVKRAEFLVKPDGLRVG